MQTSSDPDALATWRTSVRRPARFIVDGSPDLATTWSLARLAGDFGARTVPVELSLAPRSRPRRGPLTFSRRTMPWWAAERWIRRSGDGSPWCYLSNLAIGAVVPELADALPEVARLEGASEVALFVGGDGTGSWPHFDATDNLVLVTEGRKRLRLARPRAARAGAAAANFADRPALPSDPALELELGPGEAIFIPAGWWHEVDNLGVTTSLTIVHPAPPGAVEPLPERPSPSPRALAGPRALRVRSRSSPMTDPEASSALAGAPMLHVGDGTLSVAEVLGTARIHQQLGFVEAVAKIHLVRALADDRGWEIDDQALQDAADAFRSTRGLDTADATQDWLAAAGLSLDDFERYLEDRLLWQRALAEVRRQDVESYFASHRDDYAGLVIRAIRLPEAGLARELRLLVEEEGEDFVQLSHRYAIDPAERVGGGFVRAYPRTDAPSWLPDDAFEAELGALVGPVPTADGWCLVRIEARTDPVLDARTDQRIRGVLLDALLLREGATWTEALAGAAGM